MDEAEISLLCCNDPTEACDRTCPISYTPCPGICVFAEVLRSSALGIIIFDKQQQEVMFQNEYALYLMDGIVPPHDFSALKQLLLPDPSENPTPTYPYSPGAIRIKDKALGFTAYRASERFTWVLLRDVRKKIRLESIAEAVESMNNIGYIFSGIRHEIGNPINTIKLTLSVLIKKLHELPSERVLSYLEQSLSEVERVEYLLRALKSFNSLEELKPQDADIQLFITRFIELVRSDMENNGISINYSCADQQLHAFVDTRALHQVLLNVVTNAADALKKRLEPTIHIDSHIFEDRLLIKVTDNGCGMSEEQQELLFKPFVTNKEDGTGLGLVISRKALAKMGGIIYVESREGCGTTITISLPRTSNEEHQIWPPT